MIAAPPAAEIIDGFALLPDGGIYVADYWETMRSLGEYLASAESARERQLFLGLAASITHSLIELADPAAAPVEAARRRRPRRSRRADYNLQTMRVRRRVFPRLVTEPRRLLHLWRADYPVAQMEAVAVIMAAAMLEASDTLLMELLALYAGLLRDDHMATLVELLSPPRRQRTLTRILSAAAPVRYLAGATRRALGREHRQLPQARMEPMDKHAHTIDSQGEDAREQIDIDAFLRAVRASGHGRAEEMAAIVETWLEGEPLLSDAARKRLQRFLAQQRARAMAARTRATIIPGYCAWMAPRNWVRTVRYRQDSVWHHQNLKLLY